MDSRNAPRPHDAWLRSGRRVEVEAFQVGIGPGVAFARVVKTKSSLPRAGREWEQRQELLAALPCPTASPDDRR